MIGYTAGHDRSLTRVLGHHGQLPGEVIQVVLEKESSNHVEDGRGLLICEPQEHDPDVPGGRIGTHITEAVVDGG